MHSMFFLHLAVEKMLKCLYVNQLQIEAPLGHNLQNLVLKIVKTNFPKDVIALLSEITTFNISARYDDYKQSFYQICDKNFSKKYLRKGKELLKWLISLLK